MRSTYEIKIDRGLIGLSYQYAYNLLDHRGELLKLVKDYFPIAPTIGVGEVNVRNAEGDELTVNPIRTILKLHKFGEILEFKSRSGKIFSSLDKLYGDTKLEFIGVVFYVSILSPSFEDKPFYQQFELLSKSINKIVGNISEVRLVYTNANKRWHITCRVDETDKSRLSLDYDYQQLPPVSLQELTRVIGDGYEALNSFLGQITGEEVTLGSGE